MPEFFVLLKTNCWSTTTFANSIYIKSSDNVYADGGLYPRHKLFTISIKKGCSTIQKETQQQIKNLATAWSQICCLTSSIVSTSPYFVINCWCPTFLFLVDNKDTSACWIVWVLPRTFTISKNFSLMSTGTL
jgi:hypothetical protein